MPPKHQRIYIVVSNTAHGCPWRIEGIRYPGAAGTGGCEPPGLLPRQQPLLIADLATIISFKTFSCYLLNFADIY